MGVITVTDVDYGRIYGPFPDVGHIPQSYFIGYLTADERHETGHVKINLNDGSLGNTWLPYVHPARHLEEQNMEAYHKDGHIFYRTLRIIRAKEELLVWYSKDFAQILEIPFKTYVHSRDSSSKLKCESCGDEFCYVFPLMAHIRFRCSKISKIQSFKHEEQNESSKKDHTIQEITATNTDRPTVKRSLEQSKSETTGQKIFIETLEENNNDKNSERFSPEVIRVKQDIGSAFRKVEKSILKDADNLHNEIVHACKDPINMNETKVKLFKATHDISRNVYTKNLIQPICGDSNLVDNISMLVNSWVSPMTSASHHAYINSRLSLTSVGNTEFNGHMNTLSHDSFRNIHNADVFSKQMLLEQLRKSHLPCIQTTNPMVEKILQTTTPTMLQSPIQPLNLAQNWCAKCNATFRMTSDLVYHMRSHHKREFDPIKRKRDDKLQCHVCKETFKERHHLTRHMTSHT